MIESGTVLERRSDGSVVVEVNRTSACDGCHAKGACSMGFGSRRAQVTAHDPVGAQVGQTVTLEVGDGAFLAACAWVYLVPLAGLLFGAALAYVLTGWARMTAARDTVSALSALAGLGIGIAVVWLYDRRVRDARGAPTGRFQVRVRAISAD
ncbi:MAG: SoxR reducing system RseC family protein [Myxococcales bacterium]|jgi:sigma-E factor negative regulatory protein RseC